MNFAENLKKRRAEKGIGQRELADLSGVSYRTIQNWEGGIRRPSNFESVEKVAAVLGTSASDLLSDTDKYIIDAQERGGNRAKRDVESLVEEVSGLFAGGELDEDEKAGVIAALNQAYWVAKEKNRKYAPKGKRD